MNDFFAGQVFNSYEYFGAHKESGRIVFRTFAPNAANVVYSEASITGRKNL